VLRLRRLGAGVRSSATSSDDKKLLAAGNVDAASKSAVGAGRRAHG
jgi:hypothetical protein